MEETNKSKEGAGLEQPWQRIEWLMDHYGMTINAFSVECGFTASKTLWNIINHKKKPQVATLKKIAHRFQEVSYNWLLTGKGERFQKDPVKTLFGSENESELSMQKAIITKLIDHVTEMELKVAKLELKQAKLEHRIDDMRN